MNTTTVVDSWHRRSSGRSHTAGDQSHLRQPARRRRQPQPGRAHDQFREEIVCASMLTRTTTTCYQPDGRGDPTANGHSTADHASPPRAPASTFLRQAVATIVADWPSASSANAKSRLQAGMNFHNTARCRASETKRVIDSGRNAPCAVGGQLERAPCRGPHDTSRQFGGDPMRRLVQLTTFDHSRACLRQILAHALRSENRKRVRLLRPSLLFMRSQSNRPSLCNGAMAPLRHQTTPNPYTTT